MYMENCYPLWLMLYESLLHFLGESVFSFISLFVSLFFKDITNNFSQSSGRENPVATERRSTFENILLIFVLNSTKHEPIWKFAIEAYRSPISVVCQCKF